MTTRFGSRLPSASVLLGGILAIAAVARLWGLGFGLPHTQARPDETQIIDVTLYFLRGDFKPPFYDYPWFYMWMLTGLYMAYYAWGVVAGDFNTVSDLVASWPVNWAPFFLISRGLSAAAGTATVLVVYRLARKHWDERTALVSALFMALTFIHARDSHFGTTDVVMTLFIVLSVSLLISAHLTRRRILFAAAGLTGGLAAGTKYNGAFLVAPLLASYFLNIIDSPGRRLWAMVDYRLLWFTVPFAAALGISVPFLFADIDRFWAAMQELSRSMQHGQGTFTPENGWLHHLTHSLRYGMTLPLLVAGVAGCGMLLFRQPRLAVLLLAFPVAYFAVAGSFGNLFFRYMIPVAPFLALAAAWLVTDIVRRFTPSPLALGLVAVGVILPSALSTWHFNRIVAATDNRVLVAQWFADHVRPGESVVQSGSIYGYAQLDNRIWVPWTWDRNRKTFLVKNRRAEGRPDWILIQDSPLPSMTQDVVNQFLTEGYAEVKRFPAFSAGPRRVYDRQDAFFVPFAGFSGVDRPGPNFTLYRRAPGGSTDDERSKP